jgi:DNA-directed RNA polymerase specialized sigma54-like protein
MGESTLSRLIKNKYMDTPIGTIKIQDNLSDIWSGNLEKLSDQKKRIINVFLPN